MVADKRKPVKDIAVAGIGKVELIGHGLARLWLVVEHVGEGGKIERRLRKRPWQMPVDTLPHSILLMTQAVADSMAKPGAVATISDGDGQTAEDRH